ncbi:flagellar assembly protein FliH [Paenibacillus shirakamiensis]|uniref:Flagellar assembly protein FliH n=1 Tax=Paenibacillus shirakamiensis TaxID=1265935 RepID=A0ABS4JHB7_9BACL|nr:FliH/SctL family protein [Paenibacillus shirakamiensis]MBP2001120.1 flagellar assembly protein FliH [Paenibacillus shirakamiensis]
MSNLIKSTQYVPVDMLKELDLSKHYSPPVEHESPLTAPPQSYDAEVNRVRNEQFEEARRVMLHDAKDFAERQVREASEKAERLLIEANQQIAAWWQERREQDEHLIEAVKAEAFHEGFEEGKASALDSLEFQIQEMMEEGRQVLQQAYQAKEQIIQEAEPFLVELSASIAEKVIDTQLKLEPEFALELIRKSLSRKKEQGVLTLCVAPSQFSFIQGAREELSLVIDSQAELQILPDSTVKDRGCVIRSAFGSIDARVDTQLIEIKKELLRMSLHPEEQGTDHDEA